MASNRLINYLRISITDRCNFRCFYCLSSSRFKPLEHDKIAKYEEILRIVRLFCKLGITKVRITGGEPFTRKNVFFFYKGIM